MDKELINFVEGLPENSELFTGLSIEETVKLVNELVESDDETLKQLVKQYKGMELFKKGGKLDYLLCLKKGGPMDCGCGKKIEKAAGGSDGVGEDRKRRTDKEGDVYRQGNTVVLTTDSQGTVPTRGSSYQMSGGVPPQSTYVTGTPGNRRVKVYNDYENVLMPQAKYIENPGNPVSAAIMRLFGGKQAKPEYWEQVNTAMSVNGYKEGGELQNGGEISRKKAIDSADSRKEGRKQYRQNKKTMRDNGYRGKEMKQAARKATIRQSFANRPVESTPISTPAASFVAQVPQIERPVTMSSRIEDDYGHLMGKRAQAMIGAEQASKFSDAFRIARNAGLLTFKWNGKEYNTQLADPRSAETKWYMHPKFRGYDEDTMGFTAQLYESDPEQTEKNLMKVATMDYVSRLPLGIVNPTIPETVDVVEEIVEEEPLPKIQSTQQAQRGQLPVGWYGQFMINK